LLVGDDGVTQTLNSRHSTVGAKDAEATSIRLPAPYALWYATQVSRKVRLVDRQDPGQFTEFEAPAAWGKDWAWRVTEDGGGIELFFLGIGPEQMEK
jgi:hypothetical protein